MSWSKLINILLYILLFGFLFSSIARCNREQDKISILEQNYLAARDAIEVLEMKNGDLLYEKSLYILNEKELTSQLNIAKEDIKDLKNKLNSALNTISKIQGTIQYDTITIPGDTIRIIEPNTYIHQFNYNDQWLKLSGETTINNNFAQTSIYNISVPVDLVVDNMIFLHDNAWSLSSLERIDVNTPISSAIFALASFPSFSCMDFVKLSKSSFFIF